MSLITKKFSLLQQHSYDYLNFSELLLDLVLYNGIHLYLLHISVLARQIGKVPKFMA